MERTRLGEERRQLAIAQRSVSPNIMNHVNNRIMSLTRFTLRTIERRADPRYDRQEFKFYLTDRGLSSMNSVNFAVTVYVSDYVCNMYNSELEFWAYVVDRLFEELNSPKYTATVESSYRHPRYQSPPAIYWGDSGDTGPTAPSQCDEVKQKVNPFIDSASHVEI
jgi:hypothetical protein